MKVSYRQAARDDVVRQFRYYLVEQSLPDVAIRFREAIRQTIDSLRERPLIGARYQPGNPRFRKLRSWPVNRFEDIRIFYLLDDEVLHVIRILHGKRDIKRILRSERNM